MLRHAVRALVAVAGVPALVFGWSWLTAPPSFLHHLDRGFAAVSASAWLATAVPALILAHRRPVAALVTVLLYPVIWIAILSRT